VATWSKLATEPMHAEAIKLDPSSAAKRLMFNDEMQ
jgi:hypothetical protein